MTKDSKLADRPHVALLIETSRTYGRGILRGIKRYLAEHEPWLVYMELRGLDSSSPGWLRNWEGQGILTRTGGQKMATAVIDAGLPTVELRSPRMMPTCPFVGVDNSSIGRMIFSHFHERGIRNFGVFGISTEHYFEDRHASFSEAVEDGGYRCHVYQQGHRHERPVNWERQQDKLSEWLISLPKPVGLMACTDQLGFWLLEACKRSAISVPDEVAVVGCENDESLAGFASPPLSSVQFNSEQTGYEAARILDQMMRGGGAPAEPTLLPPLGIVTRQSSDTVAVEDPEAAEAISFIQEYALNGIGVSDVLEAIPVSRTVLDQKMRRYLGRTVKSEILRVQLDGVKQLLLDTDLSLAQIADRTGFRHPQYMAELFKKKCGITPGMYRSGCRSDHQ